MNGAKKDYNGLRSERSKVSEHDGVEEPNDEIVSTFGRKLSKKRRSSAIEIDLDSPESILTKINLKAIINQETLHALPLDTQRMLVDLLPLCDRQKSTWDSQSVLTASETTEGPFATSPSYGVGEELQSVWLHPSALSNEFFGKALQDYADRQAKGEFSQRVRNRAGLRASVGTRSRYTNLVATDDLDECTEDKPLTPNGTSRLHRGRPAPRSKRLSVKTAQSLAAGRVGGQVSRTRKYPSSSVHSTANPTSGSDGPDSIPVPPPPLLEGRSRRPRRASTRLLPMVDDSKPASPLSSHTSGQSLMVELKRSPSSLLDDGLLASDVPMEETSETRGMKHSPAPLASSAVNIVSPEHSQPSVGSCSPQTSKSADLVDSPKRIKRLSASQTPTSTMESPTYVCKYPNVSPISSPHPGRASRGGGGGGGSTGGPSDTPTPMPPPRQTKTLATMREKMRAKRLMKKAEQQDHGGSYYAPSGSMTPHPASGASGYFHQPLGFPHPGDNFSNPFLATHCAKRSSSALSSPQRQNPTSPSSSCDKQLFHSSANQNAINLNTLFHTAMEHQHLQNHHQCSSKFIPSGPPSPCSLPNVDILSPLVTPATASASATPSTELLNCLMEPVQPDPLPSLSCEKTATQSYPSSPYNTSTSPMCHPPVVSTPVGVTHSSPLLPARFHSSSSFEFGLEQSLSAPSTPVVLQMGQHVQTGSNTPQRMMGHGSMMTTSSSSNNASPHLTAVSCEKPQESLCTFSTSNGTGKAVASLMTASSPVMGQPYGTGSVVDSSLIGENMPTPIPALHVPTSTFNRPPTLPQANENVTVRVIQPPPPQQPQPINQTLLRTSHSYPTLPVTCTPAVSQAVTVPLAMKSISEIVAATTAASPTSTTSATTSILQHSPVGSTQMTTSSTSASAATAARSSSNTRAFIVDGDSLPQALAMLQTMNPQATITQQQYFLITGANKQLYLCRAPLGKSTSADGVGTPTITMTGSSSAKTTTTPAVTTPVARTTAVELPVNNSSGDMSYLGVTRQTPLTAIASDSLSTITSCTTNATATPVVTMLPKSIGGSEVVTNAPVTIKPRISQPDMHLLPPSSSTPSARMARSLLACSKSPTIPHSNLIPLKPHPHKPPTTHFPLDNTINPELTVVGKPRSISPKILLPPVASTTTVASSLSPLTSNASRMPPMCIQQPQITLSLLPSNQPGVMHKDTPMVLFSDRTGGGAIMHPAHTRPMDLVHLDPGHNPPLVYATQARHTHYLSSTNGAGNTMNINNNNNGSMLHPSHLAVFDPSLAQAPSCSQLPAFCEIPATLFQSPTNAIAHCPLSTTSSFAGQAMPGTHFVNTTLLTTADPSNVVTMAQYAGRSIGTNYLPIVPHGSPAGATIMLPQTVQTIHTKHGHMLLQQANGTGVLSPTVTTTPTQFMGHKM